MSKDQQTEAIRKGCQNSGCQVAETGKCLEGVDPFDQCPHYRNGQLARENARTKKKDQEGRAKDEIRLPSGDPLEAHEAERTLRAFGGSVVALVGPTESGKTTIVASLYDLLQRGPFCGYSFTASRTLPAFEQRCHYARTASRRASPRTERTPIGLGLKYLHLALSCPDGQRLDLLLSERSGEAYRAAADNHDACVSLLEITRADLVLILVDGKQLSDPNFRHAVSNSTKMLLQALVEAQVVGLRHRVCIALTKYDLVKGCADEERVLADFQDLILWIKSRFQANIGEILDKVIAARPEREILPAGFGLSDILDACARVPTKALFAAREVPKPYRAFHRFRL